MNTQYGRSRLHAELPAPGLRLGARVEASSLDLSDDVIRDAERPLRRRRRAPNVARMELDESRHPLDEARVDAALAASGWSGPRPILREALGSPAQEAADLLAHGSAAYSCVVAERVAEDGPGAQSPAALPDGSVLRIAVVVPGTEAAREVAWLTNLVSLAVVEALRAVAKVPAEIVWPDGITVPGAACGGGSAGTRRAGGVRVDTQPRGYVVSIALNVGVGMLELPPGATALYADGGRIDRAEILAALLPAIAARVQDWRDDSVSARRHYRDRCQSIGRLVEVDGVEGRVTGVDESGDLVLEVDGAAHSLPAAT